jgi:beta-hydroxylase
MAAFFTIFNFKFWLLVSYISSITYTHFRGDVRLKPLRQLTDHSSLLAPVNALMYLFSAVPKTPYINVADFPELKILRDNWETIRDEAAYLYNEGYITASEKYDDIGFNSFFRRGWKRFYLKWYDKPLSSAETLCPKTLALIQNIPSVNAAMFALLPKDSFLFEHRDPYAGSIRYHLGLITPNSKDCCIYVDGQPYFWENGKDVLFDETYVHHAENTTTQDRIILFCDIRRPLTNALANKFNHLFSRTVMKAASSKNMPEERVGTINKLFKYLYQVRLVGKWLKNYNTRVYYLTKYTLYLGLLYAVFFR